MVSERYDWRLSKSYINTFYCLLTYITYIYIIIDQLFLTLFHRVFYESLDEDYCFKYEISFRLWIKQSSLGLEISNISSLTCWKKGEGKRKKGLYKYSNLTERWRIQFKRFLFIGLCFSKHRKLEIYILLDTVCAWPNISIEGTSRESSRVFEMNKKETKKE